MHRSPYLRITVVKLHREHRPRACGSKRGLGNPESYLGVRHGARDTVALLRVAAIRFTTETNAGSRRNIQMKEDAQLTLWGTLQRKSNQTNRAQRRVLHLNKPQQREIVYHARGCYLRMVRITIRF